MDTRLLSLASNVTRLYSQWSHRVLPVAVLSKGETYETSEPVEQVVSGRGRGGEAVDTTESMGRPVHPTHPMPQVGTILNNLYQLGLQLGKLSQVSNTPLNPPAGLSHHCSITPLPSSLLLPLCPSLPPDGPKEVPR